MKKILMAIAITSLIASCTTTPIQSIPAPVQTPQKVKVEWLSEEVDHGLSKVKIDDTTTVLIYRGVESCTMIRLK